MDGCSADANSLLWLSMGQKKKRKGFHPIKMRKRPILESKTINFFQIFKCLIPVNTTLQNSKFRNLKENKVNTQLLHFYTINLSGDA